jgi:hypothetical protein
VKTVSISKLSRWLWDVTAPIRHEVEALVFLDGMEQTTTVVPHRKSTEVVFSVFLSDRCEEQDLIDAENTIKGMAFVLEGAENRKREEVMK